MPSPRETLQSFVAVVVTGGSSGLGKSFIQVCAKLGPDLIFCNLSRRNPFENSPGLRGFRLNHFPCDLSRAPEVARAAAAVSAHLRQVAPTGRILLVNNSGAGAFGRFADLDLGRQLELIDLNVRSVVSLTGLLLPLLRERGGAIMNIASIVAYQPTPFSATYGASKAFLLHWSIALGEELRGSGVSVLAVCPGTTATDFFRNARVAPGVVAAGSGMSPEGVVEEALRALGSARPQVVTGRMNRLAAWVAARLPKPLAARLAGRVLARRAASPEK